MATRPIGPLLKEWREHRRLSQLALAEATGVSQRHLSFVETGKSKPSRELVLHLAEGLDVPLRERNVLLHAAGFAPQYQETALEDPEMASVKRAIDLMLERHDPYPAVALDRHWNLVRANQAATTFTLEWASPESIEAAGGNLLRLFTHPTGLGQHIVNLEELAAATAVRLRRELIADPADAHLQELIEEATAMLGVGERTTGDVERSADFVLPLHMRRGTIEIKMFSTLATIGSPRDITIQELVIELFFPADDATEQYFRARESSNAEFS